MTHHVLKVEPEYMDAVESGAKPFEVRVNDRAFQTGDTLTLFEIWRSGIHSCDCVGCTYAGRGRCSTCYARWQRLATEADREPTTGAAIKPCSRCGVPTSGPLCADCVDVVADLAEAKVWVA